VETGRLVVEAKAEALAAMFDAVLARLSSPSARICSVDQARLQVAAVEALPTEIRSIEPAFCRKVTKNGEPLVVVDDITQDLEACMESGSLPSEIGAAWAGSANLAAA
jgi:hypothetical protein